jgi:hypothetical protein
MAPCPCRATDFGRKYIWPKAVLPSATALITAAHKGMCGRMTLDSVENVSWKFILFFGERLIYCIWKAYRT